MQGATHKNSNLEFSIVIHIKLITKMHTKLFSSQIVQNHQFSSHYYSFIQLCRGCAEVSESQSTFNKSKVVDDVPQLIEITRRCVSDLVPECFSCNYFDLLTILISEEVYS